MIIYELVQEPESNSSEATYLAYEELDAEYRDKQHMFTRAEANETLHQGRISARGFDNLLRQGSIQRADKYSLEDYYKRNG